ncbi:hypothetical protein CEXT_788171 [Caerostris extrusa]|uniref:Uncharacterized protein n=1 Tax=Caerostris extrusa TaxID=172846 RepID=A0AAV4S4Q0_CAEEX|nr:hypothetical protein CEXT_788171 [Caerostris extrusa]
MKWGESVFCVCAKNARDRSQYAMEAELRYRSPKGRRGRCELICPPLRFGSNVDISKRELLPSAQFAQRPIDRCARGDSCGWQQFPCAHMHRKSLGATRIQTVHFNYFITLKDHALVRKFWIWVGREICWKL